MSQPDRPDHGEGAPGATGTSHRWRHAFLLLTTSVLAGAIVFCIFTPRMAVWKGLHVPPAQFNPEINRAATTLKLLDDPFADDVDLGLTNLGLAWRKFFPVLAHYLHFNETAFLAIPFVGCLLVLLLVSYTSWKETGNHWLSFLITLLTAAAPWFFVSTGWLTYADSWWVLGLLIVSLAPSRAAIVVACLITPWIDERFVVGLPLATVVRAICLHGAQPKSLRRWWQDVALVILPTAPYVVIRIVAVFGQDATADHFTREWQRIGDATLWRFIEGWWSGYRAAWIFVVAFLVVAWRRRPRITLLLAIPGVLLTSAAGLLIAADMSRGLMMLMPVVVAGCVLFLRLSPRYGIAAIYTTVLANLFVLPFLTPLITRPLFPDATPGTGSHVLWYFKVPIHHIGTELDQLKHPPDYVNPKYYFAYGNRAYDNDQPEEAILSFTYAITLDPEYADGHFARGVVHWKIGETELASLDLRRAIDVGGPDWPQRAQCQHFLDTLGTRTSPE